MTIPYTADALAACRLVAVGSTNPVKVAAVRAVLARCAPAAVVYGVGVPSGVPDQPWGDDETRRGAESRARGALAAAGADLAVGLEGGVVREPDGAVRSCAWAVAVDRGGVLGTGGSLAMPLPRAVVARLEAGEELGHAMDAVARTSGTKHGLGAVGLLTAGLIDRQGAYETLVTYALAPWLGAALFAAPVSDGSGDGPAR
ncbi:MAG: inosine/xanthosine triphosphatase [Gemmatimonadaceae bacterium]|jgi:inosine/xanthosine triphosphatase|nr:inosine/xanthosine triphosphatase [Gemmatimonadaceae bacterium]